MINYNNFKELFEHIGGVPEFELLFKDMHRTYMIIKYDDHVSFQRCGHLDGSGEFNYLNLDELYHSELIDGICLEREWDKLETIIANSSFDLSSTSDIEALKKIYCHI